MKHLRNFDSYKKQKQINESYNQKVLLLHDVELGKTDEELFRNIFEKVLTNYKISNDIKSEIRSYITETEMLNEGFFDKLKERFPKAAEVSKALSDKAEAALGNILNKVKDAVSFVKKIGEGIKEFFMAIFEKGKKFFTEQIQGGKLKGKIDELTKTKKEGLVADLKTIKEVTNFYRKDFMSKLLASKEKNMTEFLSKEQEPIAEAMLTEGKNVIATLVHGVERFPPFSWLHKIAQAGEAGAAALVKAISELTQKLGGPSFELPVVVLLVGIVIEQIIKGSAGHWLINLAGSTTPLGMAIAGIKMVAFFVALIVALDATIGEKILGGHGDHGHGEEHGEKKEGEAKSEGETATEGKPEEGEATAEETETK